MAELLVPNPYEKNRQDLVALIELLFADNITEEITPADARQALLAVLHSAFLKKTDVLRSNQLRGGMHTKPTLAERDAIAPNLREVGMSCYVANPANATELALGVRLPAATFQLIQAGGNLYEAFAPESSRLVNAAWVKTSGTEKECILSYPEFQPEDAPYLKGDAIQYTFEAGHAQAGATLLFEAKRDLSDFINPAPTGSINDPNWKPFAPLASVTHMQNTDQGTNADLFEIGMTELVDGAGEYYRGLLLNKSEGEGKGFLGAMVQDADGQPCFELVQCRDYVRGGPNVFEPLGGGDPLVSLTTNTLEFPLRQLVATRQSGAEVTVPITELTTVQAVVFTDFESDGQGGGGIQPYTFRKGVVYRDTVALEAYECLVEHTVTSRAYPTPGPLFARVPYLTLDYGVKLKQDMANLPGKMPRYYATHTGGQLFSGDTLNAVAGTIGNGLGQVYVMGHGTLTGPATLRYNNPLYGNGKTLEMNYYGFNFGRGAQILDLHLRNGKLELYGTTGRTMSGGSLTNVAIGGPGGQQLDAYGTRMACDPGFKLLQDGAVLHWYGTKDYPEPVLPDGADLSGGSVQIFPYVPPAGDDNGGDTPGDSSGLVSEGSAGPGLYNIVAGGIEADNDVAGNGDVCTVLGGQRNVIDDFLDEEGNPVAYSTIATIVGSNGCTILGGNRVLILRSENSVINNSIASTIESCENCGIINTSTKCRVENSLGCTLSSCENVQLDNCSFLFLDNRRNERYVNNVLQGPATPAGSDEIVATVLNNGSSAFSDLLQTSHQQLTSVSAQYNATNWQAQVLRADGSAAGPVRNTIATLNADVAALYAEGPVAFHLLRLTLDRLTTSDVAYANFTFTAA